MLLRCSTCKLEKSSDIFYKSRNTRTGFHNQCRPCTRATAAKKQKENSRKDYLKHRAARLEAIRQYHKAHPEIVRKAKRAYEDRNRVLLRIKGRAHMKRAWQDPIRRPKILANVAKRRAVKKGATICDFTPKQWQDVLGQFDHRCCYCLKLLDGLTYTSRPTQDHLIPLAKGGNHTLSNIVPACRSCNSQKQARTYAEFLPHLPPQSDDLPRPFSVALSA